MNFTASTSVAALAFILKRNTSTAAAFREAAACNLEVDQLGSTALKEEGFQSARHTGKHAAEETTWNVRKALLMTEDVPPGRYQLQKACRSEAL